MRLELIRNGQRRTVNVAIAERPTEEGMLEETPPIRLLSPAGAPQGYFADFGWTGQGEWKEKSFAGQFRQTIDTTQLAEGYHYLTARAYRVVDRAP